MKAEEKAKELVFMFGHARKKLFKDSVLHQKHGIEDALICVNEMIKQNGKYYLLHGGSLVTEIYKKENAFLFEVKQEIEKLNK